MGSDEIYEGFKYQILWNQMGSDEIYDGFKYQILWNPMGSDEIYDGFKYQIQSCLLLRGDFLGTSYLLGGVINSVLALYWLIAMCWTIDIEWYRKSTIRTSLSE